MGKKSSKTKTTTTMPAWAQPLAQGAAHSISNAVNANQPAAQATADAIRGQLPGLATKAFGNDPTLGAANSYTQDVLGGKYLDQNNPFMQGMIDQTDASVSDQVNSLFGKSGASLGTQHAGVLSKSLADSENNLRYGNYANERQAQGQAASMAPQLFGSQFAGIPSYLSAAQTGTQIPLMGPQAGLGVGGLWAGQGTQTSTQPGGWGPQLLGAAASALPFILSEPSAKADIAALGPWDDKGDGLTKYSFRYKHDPSNTINVGVMADEVEALRPWALGAKLQNGWRTVNYAKLREAA